MPRGDGIRAELLDNQDPNSLRTRPLHLTKLDHQVYRLFRMVKEINSTNRYNGNWLVFGIILLLFLNPMKMFVWPLLIFVLAN